MLKYVVPVIMVLALGACAKRPVAQDVPVAPAAPAVAPETPAVAQPAVAPTAGVAGSATITTVSGGQLEPVFFEYDSSVVGPEAQQALRRNAELLRASAGAVTVEGHCDERGSDEYNLALGAQRAEAVKSFLVTLGVDAARLNVISYGEERPAVTGSDESAWSKNRRAAFN